jgi:hypothetical protein
MRYNLQRRKYPDGPITLEHVDRIIQWNFLEMNDVPKVPANDERATVDGGDSNMQRIFTRLFRNNSCFQIGISQLKRLLRNFGYIDDVKKLVKQRSNFFRTTRPTAAVTTVPRIASVQSTPTVH